jgi:hypothetical protein
MVPAKSWESPKLLDDGFFEFSSAAVFVLQRIITEDTTIMLTTSHKSRYTLEEWRTIFYKRGIKVNQIKSLDESDFSVNRREEILNWFHFNTTQEEFIIIDDDKSLNALPSFLKDKLILTSSIVGLSENHLDEINSKTAMNKVAFISK